MTALIAAVLGHPIRISDTPACSLRIGFVERCDGVTEWRQAGDPVLPSSFSGCGRWCGQ